MRRYMAWLLVIGLLASVFIDAWVQAGSGQSDPPAWALPSVMAVRRVSPVSSAQNEPYSQGNIDCSLVEYHAPGSSMMQQGCFAETAFGFFDGNTVIFNGTDEGVPLLPYMSQTALMPWPKSGNLVALSAALISGSYLSLYSNPLGHLQDERNVLGQITAKHLTAGPDLPLHGPGGQPLIINPQTLAFSDGGSWLVAEDLNGSFVRINLATLDALPFATAYGSTGSPGLLESQVAISHDGRYAAIANKAAGAFKVYDLSTCGSAAASSLAPLNCQSYDYESFVEQQIKGAQSIHHVRFVNDGLLSFTVTASDPAADGIYELAPTSSISSLIDYLGLGDSYTSGEGSFDYLSGTDTADNACHLSIHSYPLLLTRDLFSAAGGHSVACSGAVINDLGITSNDYHGQVANVPSWQQLEQDQPELLSSIMTNFLPGFVAQQRFVRQYQPGITTVGVGGNDVGFGDMVIQCVEQHISLHLSDNTCFNTYEDRLEIERLIDRTVSHWAALYKELSAAAPATRLYAIGYPQIVYDQGNCALNVHLSKSELEFTEEVVDYLNGGIEQAATKAGIPYVDISQALAGHRLCEASSYDVAVNGLTAGKDAGFLGLDFIGHESYHPNALGQQLIEQAILRQTHNFQATTAANSGPPDSSRLLNKPKTGRTVQVRTPVSSMTDKVVKAGRTTPVRLSGSQAGLKPNASYNIRLDGPTGSVIGTVTSSPTGDIVGEVTMPPGTTAGGHTIDVTGNNQDDEPTDVTQPVYVPRNDGDADGDGIPDGQDACPYAVNSGTDSDQDGIDDSCDPLIGQSPASGGTTNSSGSAGSSGPDAGTPTPLTVFSGAGNATSGLGLTTANPQKAGVLKLSSPVLTKAGPPSLPLSRLPAIHWLTWLALPVLAWLLILLLSLALGILRKNMYQNHRLSTTISS
jgi:hypothetical protein